MKMILCFICLLTGLSAVKSQTPGEEIANKIAWKMKDSLQLTDSQRIEIFQINMQITQQKANVRSQYTGSDSLRIKIQQVENTRDDLYQAILSYEKYVLYLQKKRKLVNNN
jgi:hypothetical protein